MPHLFEGIATGHNVATRETENVMVSIFRKKDDRSQDPSRRPAATDKMPIPDQQDVVTVAPPTGRHLEENPAAENPLLNPDGPR